MLIHLSQSVLFGSVIGSTSFKWIKRFGVVFYADNSSWINTVQSFVTSASGPSVPSKYSETAVIVWGRIDAAVSVGPSVVFVCENIIETIDENWERWVVCVDKVGCSV